MDILSIDRDALEKRATYQGPKLDCDIVMKGGITSGIVYPLAACRLAAAYRFRSIGGSSAGAIAAAACAAAEYGRESAGGGFPLLAALPAFLGESSNLRNLFQPARRCRPLMRLLAAYIEEAGTLRWLWEIVRAAAGLGQWPWLAAALAPGLTILWVASRTHSAAWLLGSLAGVAVALAGVLLAALWRLWRVAPRVIEENHFGLCSGGTATPRVTEREPSRKPPSTDYPLTYWLADELDLLAGLDGQAPLTFEDLRRRNIELAMITTNLTHGRPYRLPLEFNCSFNSDAYFFDPEVWAGFFPPRIVKWMAEHPPRRGPQAGDRDWQDWEKLCRLLEPLKPLPSPQDLPVVAAVRLSLSFPGLISAVPLWSVDWSRRENAQARAAARNGEAVTLRPELCWFSDGGICSNFPVHFFDSPLPRWPTFGINLSEPHPDHPMSGDQAENVWLAGHTQQGHHLYWRKIDSLGGFAAAIVRTMQNWGDSTQMRVHGFWDRIAHVNLDARTEGGLNLDMEPKLIGRLSERGFHAGDKLAARFSLPSPPARRISWATHRWLRYRSTMAMLTDLLGRLKRGYEHTPQGGESTYSEMIAGGLEHELGYTWENGGQRDFAAEQTARLVDTAGQWQEGTEERKFSSGSPRPSPTLKISPPL
jgi:predicted acylesterase/phospholipase RssA